MEQVHAVAGICHKRNNSELLDAVGFLMQHASKENHCGCCERGKKETKGVRKEVLEVHKNAQEDKNAEACHKARERQLS